MPLLPWPITNAAISDFWEKAKSTKSLHQLRNITRTAHNPSVADNLLLSPHFMPLCGNGRIDTKEDYLAYNAQLPVSKAQLLHMPQEATTGALYNLSIVANEECDDGNRIDFDGCSADCMYMDLMTSACELAVEQKNLIYEDMIYDTERKAVVISALDGIYTLEMGPGDNSLRPRLLASKDFPIDSIFRFSTAILMYSASEQKIWQLSKGETNITLLRTLPLGKWNASYPSWKAVVPRQDGPMMFRDASSWVYLFSPAETAVTCTKAEMSRLKDKKCEFLIEQTENTFLIRCGFDDRVVIGPRNCEYYHQAAQSMEKTLWADVFETVMSTHLVMQSINKIEQTYAPALSSSVNSVISIEGYIPAGGFLETSINPPRKLNSSNTIPLVYFLGEPSMLQMMITTPTSGPAACGGERCIFDNDPNYDITEENPLQHAMGSSWNALLQEQIDKIDPPLPNLYTLKANTSRYSKFLQDFAEIFKGIVDKHKVIALLKHPVTHSIWAMRKDKLVEIPKSGVKIKRSDGRCIPSGVALCDKCMWAPSGAQCRPCSENQSQTSAWVLSCKDCEGGKRNDSEANRRRLLQAQTTGISFSVIANRSDVMAFWPNATLMSQSVFSVLVATNEPVNEMKKIKRQLLNQEIFRVVVPPHVIVYFNDTGKMQSNAGGGGSGDGQISLVVILIASFALVALILLIIFLWFINSQNLMNKRQQANYHHVDNSFHTPRN